MNKGSLKALPEPLDKKINEKPTLNAKSRASLDKQVQDGGSPT
jgi:hypothetical protein